MTKIVWKFSFLLSTLRRKIRISGKKMLIWLKKVTSVKKAAISNPESFLESIFDLS